MTDTRLPSEPRDPVAFTARFDRFYGRIARLYAAGVRIAPFWRTWLGSVLPHVHGPRVLEASFGTGWLLTQLAPRFQTHGIDLNAAMVETATAECRRSGTTAYLCRSDVTALPHPSETFDTIVNTMAFTGYPDGSAALTEFARVLRPEGRIVMVDVAFPSDGNRIGRSLTKLWQLGGDIIRDMPSLFARCGFEVTDEIAGGRGSIHCYVAHRA